MLAKLSVFLGFFVAVSFGQALDCELAPATRATKCCANLPNYRTNIIAGECRGQVKTGTEPFQKTCNVMTCLMKSNNHLTSDNKIDKVAFTKYVQQNWTQFATNIETSLEKCYTDTEISKCTPLAFLYCVRTTLIRECPSASWAETEECTTLKTYYDNCPNSAILTF